MDIVRKLEIYYANMTNAERVATERILKDMRPLAELPVKKASEAYDVSATALIRVAKRIDLTGYSEMSFQMKDYLAKAQSHTVDTKKQEPKMSRLTDAFISAFSDMKTETLDEQTQRLVKMMHEAGRTIVMGIGHSGLVADHMNYLFFAQGFAIQAMTDEVLIRYQTNGLQENDLIIIISANGYQPVFSNTIHAARRQHAKVVLITMNPNARTSKDVDLTIVLPLVHQVGVDSTSVNYIDSRPVFYVFISSLQRYYDDTYPEIDRS